MASSSRSEIEMVPETSHVIISVRSESEMVPETGKKMSVELFHGAIQGRPDLIPSPEEQTANGVTTSRAPNWTIESMLQSVTSSRDTVLHLLVTNRHNDLALKVLQRGRSLLGAQNMMLETPLHYAAKVGNNEIISRLITSFPSTVKEVLRKKNEKGDTALHVAAKYGHKDVGLQLMVFDREVAYIVNKKKLSPFNIAIVKENFEMVKKMLEQDHALACTQFSNGMFPIHLAAHMGQTEMVKHFIEKYPDDAKLLDPRGRNLLHIAAEEGRNDIFRDILKGPSVGEMLTTMNNATDYEGNSLLHVAAMKGHSSLMKIIGEKNEGQGGNKNNQGLTPNDLFVRQLRATTKEQLRAMRAEILAELNMQQAPDQNSLGFHRSSQHFNAVTTSPLDLIQVISSCYLTCKVGEEHIKMANARVWPRKTDELIHCVPLLEDHMKVQVDSAVDEIYLKFPLPTKINKDFVKIEDTLGSFIQWPKD